MKNNKKGSSTINIKALLTSVIVVLATVIYIGFGDNIASFLEKYGIDYNRLAEVFSRGITDGELEVHIIDIGQGDSILIRSDEGVILIDAGPNDAEDKLRAHLNSCGIKKIDYFICTHPHEDHIGGADMVLNEYTVDTLIMNETDVSTATVKRLLDAIEKNDISIDIPEVGQVYTLGDINFTVLAPDSSLSNGGNNSSIVIRLVYGSTSFLFTGDAEVESENKIIAAFSDQQLKSDFLKVGHHGSSTSTSAQFFEAVSPDYVAISCAKGNSYGHPHRETLKLFERYGIDENNILRTDNQGTIIVISDGENLRLAS
jgi:competence protein ComEC